MNFSLISPSKLPVRNDVKTTLFPQYSNENLKTPSFNSEAESKFSTGEKSSQMEDIEMQTPFSIASPQSKHSKKILSSEEILIKKIQSGKAEMQRMMHKNRLFFLKTKQNYQNKAQKQLKPVNPELLFASTQILAKKRSREEESAFQADSSTENDISQITAGFSNFQISPEDSFKNMLDNCKIEANQIMEASKKERFHKKMSKHRPSTGFIRL